MMKRRTRVGIPSLLLLLLLAAAAGATQLTHPHAWFTDNRSAVAPSPAVTVMEQSLLDYLHGAAISIDAAIYDFRRASIRDALIAAHNRGVRVRLVTDDEAYANPSYSPYFSALEDAGIPVVADERSAIMHHKFLVIDGQVVWTGSTNLTDNGFTYNHNNSLVFASSQLASFYQAEFEQMFSDGRFGPAKLGSQGHTLDYNGISLELYFSPQDDPLSQIIQEVNAADSSIHLAIFFFTSGPLGDAILGRMAQGVTVSGVWDSLGAGNTFSQDEVLCAAGAAIKREDFGGKLHHKFMIIDADDSDPTVITGSMNWSGSGGSANDENTLILHDGGTAQVYLAAFQALYDALGDDTNCQASRSTLYLPLVAGPANAPTTANVVISQVVYDPDGADLDGEYVRLENLGSSPADLEHWTLRDGAGTIYTFPRFSLAPAAAVQVWVKSGSDSSSDLYWGRGRPVWNNDGDTATLADAAGRTIDSCSYAGGGVLAACLP